MTDIKSIPANEEAESAVLGSLMIDPDAMIRIGGTLKADDFFFQKHQEIYKTLSSLSAQGKPLDYISITTDLESRGAIGPTLNYSTITELINATGSALYVEHYASIVKEASTRRKILSVAAQIAGMAGDESITIGELVNRAQAKILNVSFDDGAGRKDIAEITSEVIDEIEAREKSEGPMGIPTGYYALDEMLGGLQRTDLLILAARPGMGKTSLALSLAQNIAIKKQGNVGIFSLEMSSEQLVQRLLSMDSGIDANALRLGKIDDSDWPTLLGSANHISNSKIFIDDQPMQSIAEIRSKARRMAQEHGLDLLIVDYLQLMSGEGGNTTRAQNREQEISYISRSLKALARELDVPVIALSQLSRAVENRQDKRPFLSDLRESGSLEQDADLVLFIYREDYYMEETDRQNIADIIIAKHRHGATGQVSLFFDKQRTRFTTLEIKHHTLTY
jgi:replicative DNA helicase